MNLETKLLFSIVVPVYNVEQYLDKCLQSLTHQTFKNFEVILVDDGSTDSSGKICDKYAEKYDFIKVYHKENGGPSSARNYGIERTKGKYLTFVDSDDWVDNNFLKNVYDIVSLTEYDLVFWSYVQEFNNNRFEKHLISGNRCFGDYECSELRCSTIGPLPKEKFSPQTLDRYSTSCCKLYKKEIIKDNSLEFVDTKIIGTFEDGLFNFRYLKYVKTAFYIDQCYYHYRKTNENSLTSKVMLDLFDKWDNLYRLIGNDIKNENLGVSFSNALQNRVAMSSYFLISKASSSNLKKKEKINLLKSKFSSVHYSSAIKNLNLRSLKFPWNIYFCIVKLKMWSVLIFINSALKNFLKLLRG